MSSTLVYLCAIPSMFRANAVKPMSEMTILPLWAPPIFFLSPSSSRPFSLFLLPRGAGQLPANLRRRPLPPV
jgi:hypothetical protein